VSLAELRKSYHEQLCRYIIRIQDGCVNFADKGNKASQQIALAILKQINYSGELGQLAGQTAGGLFEKITLDYLKEAFEKLKHIRPGDWEYKIGVSISEFDQYKHLAHLQELIEKHKELSIVFKNEYIIKPDIVVARIPLSEEKINEKEVLVQKVDNIAKYTPLRAANQESYLLHASISCKWTLRSDRSQNARSEALNLIRQRRGNLPHIVVVVAEPLPTRIASLALGTGDIDCVYHFALIELQQAVNETGNDDQAEMLSTLINGRRLRDISDLPFDLAI
jgi:hypothetical protein